MQLETGMCFCKSNETGWKYAVNTVGPVYLFNYLLYFYQSNWNYYIYLSYSIAINMINERTDIWNDNKWSKPVKREKGALCCWVLLFQTLLFPFLIKSKHVLHNWKHYSCSQMNRKYLNESIMPKINTKDIFNVNKAK